MTAKQPTRNEVATTLQKLLQSPPLQGDFTEVTVDLYDVTLKFKYKGTKFSLPCRRYDTTQRKQWDRNRTALLTKLRNKYPADYDKFYYEARDQGFKSSRAANLARQRLIEVHKAEWAKILKENPAMPKQQRTYSPWHEAFVRLRMNHEEDFQVFLQVKKIRYPQLTAREHWTMARTEFKSKYQEEYKAILNQVNKERRS